MAHPRPPKKGFGLYYDPIYGYVPLPPMIRRALDLPSMQRLRHIKQLSTLFLFFPGATHSRFEHSVGVYYLADRVYNGLFLKREHLRKEEWPQFLAVHRIALQLGALFHDIGHGTWSHVSELLCKMREDYRKLEHTKLTQDWISKGYGPYEDISDFINKEASRLEKELKSIFPRDWKDLEPYMDILTPENIAKIAVGLPPSDPRYSFLSNIVSGTFDVDRLDYLRRDAYHSGVQIGNIDIWEIIHNYTLGEVDGKWAAQLSPSAVTAVEILLIVRDFVYRQFYYSKLHRIAQEMLIRGMDQMLQNYSLDEMLRMTDEELLVAYDSARGNAFTKDIASRIRNRNIYEPLPCIINVSNDLDPSAKKNWYELAFGVPSPDTSTERWFEAETIATKIIKLPGENRVIFDIRPVPIVKTSEYEAKIFYDEFNKKSLSLFDLAPHLRERERLYEQYIEQISQLMILLPFHCIDHISNLCLDEIKRGNNKDDVYKRHIKIFEPILDEFIKLLNMEDKEKIKTLKEKFIKDMIIYLEEICHQ